METVHICESANSPRECEVNSEMRPIILLNQGWGRGSRVALGSHSPIQKCCEEFRKPASLGSFALMQPHTREGRLLTGELCLNINKHAGKVKCPGKPRRSLSCLTLFFKPKERFSPLIPKEERLRATTSPDTEKHGSGCGLNYPRMWMQTR